ncbi:flagellar biosynthetic protein FliQ [Alicyclobacillus sacchari]|uniref:Flagellar biosynthetic protein FliQ n=2 Tax=Alicyclobacillus TaxID=29330 RepID=A0A1H2SGX1_9BACL|nr:MULTISPECIES: flagellar biosynthesis protein FliQ [Alicyclobacillus]KRW90974.1 flagellar biosynthesis protein FliQ [Alicyclobacillus tengchongensis]TDY50492.1 flagellar biosynthetic protein FliQ [Alicyclobacillus sacchari]SDW30896.1 flagellar biosynthetic protein FliQ [Alicyclobacillus hesperidum]GLG00575.1 flagellar biosynthetic protein FliQ [Alicyclobacillus hesperidum subsp. aegles]GLV12375.1 flagellar biosynthetic protein FliQ [Alicyclobacillus hesperidum]
MTDTYVIGLGAQVMWLVVKLTAPVLLLGLAVGLLVSIFQATTQIQEQTLAFVPKIAAVIVALLVFGPWMLQNLLDFANSILGNLMSYVM